MYWYVAKMGHHQEPRVHDGQHIHTYMDKSIRDTTLIEGILRLWMEGRFQLKAGGAQLVQ